MDIDFDKLYEEVNKVIPSKVSAAKRLPNKKKGTKRVSVVMSPVAEPAVDPHSLAPAPVKEHGPVEKLVAGIEKRFLEVAGLSGNLAARSITLDNHLQVKTDKTKSDKHGEVFTPLWLVDQMIDRISDHKIKDQALTTTDLCSGYGQFSVRLIRRKYSVLKESFDLDKFLGETHLFIELQPNSCFRLLHIFGKDTRGSYWTSTPDRHVQAANGVYYDELNAYRVRFAKSKYGSSILVGPYPKNQRLPVRCVKGRPDR